MALSIAQLTAEEIGLVLNRRTNRWEAFNSERIIDYLPQTKWAAKRYHEYLFTCKQPIIAYYLTLKACVRYYESRNKENEFK